MSERIDNKISVLFEGLLKKIAEERGGDLVDCSITELDFSGSIFELESLDGLRYISWKSLRAIDISNNSIDKLDSVLSKFNTLQTIIATNNLITKVNFSLPNLKELDLSRNYLKQVPDLSGAPSIERLLLGYNEITGGFNELTNLTGLILLDLSNNRISFMANDFKKFIDVLKGLTKLDSLRTHNNPFCEVLKQYEYYLIASLSSLNNLNNEIITKDLRINIKKTKLKPLDQVISEASKSAVKIAGKNINQDSEAMPKLQNLHLNMRAAKNSPTECLERFKLVARDVEKIVNRPEERFVIFKANTSEDQDKIRMYIDTFLQEAVMMIEDMPTMRTPVLRLLASLAEVEEGSLGQKCILTLQDLFVSGPEIAKEIEEILRKVIIPKIQKSKVDDISKDLLRGVIRLCKDHDISEMLYDLIPIMAEWMRAEVTSEELRLIQGEISEDSKRETHTYMLVLVALTAGNGENSSEKNAKSMADKKIGDFTAKLIKVMERETEPSNILGKQESVKDTIKRLKYILKIIENMTKNYSKSSLVFISEEIHQKLLREIWDYLVFYKANGYSFSTGSGNTESTEIMYYKLLAAYINTLAGLCTETKCVEYINTTATMIRDEILNVSIMPKTDPLLLTAIIELIEALLSSPYFSRSENTKTFIKYVEKLQKMLPFLPYLGGKKYKDICMLSEKYAKGTIVGQEPIVISSLTNKYLHRLFISIIKLIQFFSSKAMDSSVPEITEICVSISTTLNNNHREDLLFQCLEVPNDSVKLAVVKCLDKIPVDEIDIEETGHIVRILGSYKNLGVGQTEEVLSQMFLLLSKILVHPENGVDFRNKFGEMVISECLGILSKNQLRDLRDNPNENLEKSYLTVSCVYFLKKCSEFPDLHPFMDNNRAETHMRVILKAEETFLTYNDIPVDIERTWIGMNVAPLLTCFTNSDHLLPHNEVSYRVLQRIADVLNGIPEEDTYQIVQSANEQLPELIDFTKKNVEFREIRENSAWSEHTSSTAEEIQRLKKQHEDFSINRGISTILNFLLGRSSMKCIEIDKQLREEFDEIFDKQELLYLMQNKIEDIEKEYHTQSQKVKEMERKETTFADLEVKTEDPDPELLTRAMQEQDLNSEENSEVLSTRQLEDSRSKYDTPKIRQRARILAAYLRCLVAVIERGPSNTRLNAVLEIKDLKNLKNLTKLCATTGWNHSTLGAKYLRVIKHIIILSPISNFRPQEDIILFETIAVALTQILSLIRIKIANCERNALTKEDHFLIKEISGVGASLCGSVYTFQWSNEIDGIYIERTSLVIKSIQEQASAFILEQLIPLKSVKDYIEILFYDMTHRERMLPESYKLNIEEVEYMENARKSIADILSTYIALSDNSKYRVLEFCKIGVIFNEKVFNVTYLQEIMNRASTKLFAIELSKLMKQNRLTFHMPQDQVPERTVYISWGDLWEKGKNFKKVLALVTCRCIYLLDPCTSPPCPLCGEERFCPQPPTYKTHIEYTSVVRIIGFSGFNQGMALDYLEGNKPKTFVFISKNFEGGKAFVDVLVSIKEEFTNSGFVGEYTEVEPMPMISDGAFESSLENVLSLHEQGQQAGLGKPVFALFGSLNPETSLIGIMEGMRVFKRGFLIVLTEKNFLVALDINLKNWTATEKKISSYENDLSQNIFSIKYQFDLGKAGRTSIKDEAVCNFHLEIDGNDNVFQFGDDHTLEFFQRCVMSIVTKLKGGQKVKPRVKKDKR